MRPAKRKIALPAVLAIDAEVDLHLADSGYFFSSRDAQCPMGGMRIRFV